MPRRDSASGNSVKQQQQQQHQLVAPSSVSDAVAAEKTTGQQERAIRERLEKGRLEKLAKEREVREQQLKEELKKLGQDILSPVQKQKKAQQQKQSAASKSAGKNTGKDANAINNTENEDKSKEKLKLPSQAMSTFVEEPNISSPESISEEMNEEPLPKKQKKQYEYSKFGDFENSDEEEEDEYEDALRRGAAKKPTARTMKDYLNERLDSNSRDGMSPAAIVKMASEMKNSPLHSQSPVQQQQQQQQEAAFASSTFADLFTDKPYEDSPKHIPPEIASLPPYFPALSGCRSVEEFECKNRIDEGTYGVVYRAMEKKTGEMVALKRLKMEKEREGFPITSLREISTLLKAQHPNIVTVREIVVGSNMDKIYIVMDFVEHDLKALMESMPHPFMPGEVKTLMIQLLRGVAHMHDNWIIHRDLKTSNLLLSHRGVLKVCFLFAFLYCDIIYSIFGSLISNCMHLIAV